MDEDVVSNGKLNTVEFRSDTHVLVAYANFDARIHVFPNFYTRIGQSFFEGGMDLTAIAQQSLVSLDDFAELSCSHGQNLSLWALCGGQTFLDLANVDGRIIHVP